MSSYSNSHVLHFGRMVNMDVRNLQREIEQLEDHNPFQEVWNQLQTLNEAMALLGTCVSWTKYYKNKSKIFHVHHPMCSFLTNIDKCNFLAYSPLCVTILLVDTNDVFHQS